MSLFFSYAVDDGTGEILCRYDNHHSMKTVGELNELERLQDLVANRNYINPSHIGEVSHLEMFTN